MSNGCLRTLSCREDLRTIFPFIGFPIQLDLKVSSCRYRPLGMSSDNCEYLQPLQYPSMYRGGVLKPSNSTECTPMSIKGDCASRPSGLSTYSYQDAPGSLRFSMSSNPLSPFLASSIFISHGSASRCPTKRFAVELISRLESRGESRSSAALLPVSDGRAIAA